MSGSTTLGDSILPLTLESVCFDAGGRRLIRQVDTTLTSGPPTIVLGPNGAGKSLMLRLCHGLLQPSAGRVHWNVNHGSDLTRYQAMVFQRPVMLRRSVAANVDFALRLRRIDARKRRSVVGEVLDKTGLSGFARHAARTLSVGEQQRLALARAWALNPQVLFLDEPTASLDPAATYAVEEVIAAIHRAGAKIVMTTHDLAQARRIAGDVMFLHQGRLLEHSPASRFFSTPESAEAAAFLRGELVW